ncbi:MAG: dihydrolipoyl dehydrogenase [Actinobacteria bacterium RBG_16_64_13]|nr:MAG: dihydrolipoyl dehydrogenase [Actinobacteria bacterium RBG_16_64_13]
MSAVPLQIVVLGGGPGGYVAALRAARHGAVVTLVEKDLLGGTCLNRGCIPTKALLASADALARARAGEEYGFEVMGDVRPDLARMMERKDRVITQIRGNVEVLLKKAGVKVLRGAGHLAASDAAPGSGTPSRRVIVDTGAESVIIDADKVIIATGSEPAFLPTFDFTHPAILTSTSALELRRIPKSMLIVGAGVIGCEFASFFAELGTQITMVEMMPQMLPLEDKRLAKQFQGVYRKRGIQVLLKTKVESILTYADDHVVAQLSDGSELSAEKVLVSVGRRPNSAGIGLESAGVETDGRGYILVNEYLETTAPDIYAIGDVNGGQMLAHVASYEAFVAVDNCLGGRRMRDLRSTPSCTYSSPEVASVGLNEEQALENGFQPVTGTYRFAALGKALAMGEDTGYVQIVADKETDLVLGANMMGSHVTDVVHEIALAVQNGLTVSQLGDCIHGHPTIAEAVMEAAHDVHGESVHISR